MLKQHPTRLDYPYPLHEPGEVVLATFGNFLEAGEECTPKARPVILLRAGDCQHTFAGLTTKSHYLTTGDARPEVRRHLLVPAGAASVLTADSARSVSLYSAQGLDRPIALAWLLGLSASSFTPTVTDGF